MTNLIKIFKKYRDNTDCLRLLEEIRWSEGIELRHLRVKDDPVYSNESALFLENLLLSIDFRKFLDRALRFELSLNGLELQLIRNDQGKNI